MNGKFRVLYVVPNYFPFVGGIETLIRTFLRNEEARDRIEPLVIFPDRLKRFHTEESYKVEGIEVIPFAGFGTEFKWARARTASDLAKIWGSVRRITQEFKPDVIHVNGLAELTLPFLSMAKSLAILSISHIHGEVPLNTNRTLLNFIAESTRIITVSGAVRESLLSQGFIPEKIKVLVNGVSPHLSCETISKKRISNQLIMVGRLDSQKGFIEGLRTFNLLLKERPGLEMVVVGAGPEIGNLTQYVTSEGIGKKVRFVGPLSLEDTRDSICSSAVLLVPSVNIEGFGLVAAEAGMCGVPVVATNVGGLPETVIGDKSGLLVEPSNPLAMAKAVARVLSSSELHESLGAYAKSHITKNFNHSHFAHQLLHEYSSITMRS